MIGFYVLPNFGTAWLASLLASCTSLYIAAYNSAGLLHSCSGVLGGLTSPLGMVLSVIL